MAEQPKKPPRKGAVPGQDSGWQPVEGTPHPSSLHHALEAAEGELTPGVAESRHRPKHCQKALAQLASTERLSQAAAARMMKARTLLRSVCALNKRDSPQPPTPAARARGPMARHVTTCSNWMSPL